MKAATSVIPFVVMAKCAFRGAETDLHYNGVPVCLKCEKDLHKAQRSRLKIHRRIQGRRANCPGLTQLSTRNLPSRDGANAGRDARHNRTGGDSHEASHESVFDKVLTTGIPPKLKSENKVHPDLSVAFANH